MLEKCWVEQQRVSQSRCYQVQLVAAASEAHAPACLGVQMDDLRLFGRVPQ